MNPLDLQPSDVCIEDIAHALALLNRFVGHTKEPISVAQHSVYVSWLCEWPHAKQALFHDAAEAYLGDISKWVKHQPACDGFRAAEERAQRIIYRIFGCADETHAEVEAADKLMVRYEGMMGYGLDWIVDHPAYPPLTDDEVARVEQCGGEPWRFWAWQEAEQMFLRRYEEVV